MSKLVLVLAVTGSALLPAALQDEKKQPAVREIYLTVGDGWRLQIHPDGAARLGYGAADVWNGEKDTFDF
jgi:hypothetical protein